MPKKLELRSGDIITKSSGESTELIYLRDAKSIRKYDRRVVVKCYCGEIFEVFLGHIRNGVTKSCGCLRKEMYESGRAGYKHGLTSRPDYARLNYLRYTYNITPEYYDELHKKQKGKCAICGIKDTKLKSTVKSHTILHVDHCHSTGKIRGLLCNGCNRAIGFFNDDATKCLKAVDYLSKRS